MKQILLLVLSIIIGTACTPNKEQKLLILDMVHHNPGEEFTIQNSISRTHWIFTGLMVK